MYVLSFYVPETHVEQVKNAIFTTGAGSIEQYKQCAWQILGEGQFMPLTGSNAFIGTINQVEKVKEYKVEIICTNEQIQPALEALKKAHPYETPAFHAIKLEEF